MVVVCDNNDLFMTTLNVVPLWRYVYKIIHNNIIDIFYFNKIILSARICRQTLKVFCDYTQYIALMVKGHMLNGNLVCKIIDHKTFISNRLFTT